MPVRYEIDREISSRIIDGEVVILKIAETSYYSMNPVGTLVWKLLNEGPRSRGDLVAGVRGTYEVDADTAVADIDELLRDLLDQKLIRIVE